MNIAEELIIYRDALKTIAEFGGQNVETEIGTIKCDGKWCAMEAKMALSLTEELFADSVKDKNVLGTKK